MAEISNLHEVLKTRRLSVKTLHCALKVLKGKRKEEICRRSGMGMTSLEHLAEQLVPMLNGLDPRRREMLLKRYGLGGDAPKTLQAIGDEYKLTRERIRQIQNAALKKLRKKLEQGEFPK